MTSRPAVPSTPNADSTFGQVVVQLPDATTAQSPESRRRSGKLSTGEAAGVSGYELKDEIGRGGIGVVYRARDLAMNRDVAVKLLQVKFAPNSATAGRFVEEAQITGQLQHPGIPAVYRVGQADDGRPFLAMKLIKGETLNDLLAKRGQTGDESLNVLAVFEAICQAVGYAHAHFVIHRDLKPANVMVGSFGEVQVMDWGLAKVIRNAEFGMRNENQNQNQNEERVYAHTEIQSLRDTDGSATQAGLVMGTPAYMPPEQAAGEHEKVDRRSDVFGLGAILCALLTGKPPYEGTSAESVRLNAVRGQTGDAKKRLDDCGAEPDVVALCKRCLSFDPADRPADAEVLAREIADLRRDSEERAKQAEMSRATAVIQIEEQSKRRKMAIAAGIAVAAVLAAGIVGTLIGLNRSEIARKDAVNAQNDEARQRVKAEAKEAEATTVLKFLDEKVFSAARPKGQEGGLGKDVTLRAAIEAALPAIDTDFRDQPLTEARLRTTVGNTFWFLGDLARADAAYERAWRLSVERGGPPRETLTYQYNLAFNRMSLGRDEDALTRFEDAVRGQTDLLGPDHVETVASKTGLAHCYESAGRHAEALALREEVLATSRRTFGPESPNALMCEQNLANSFASAGRHAEALKLREESVRIQTRIHGDDHPATLVGKSCVVQSYVALRRYADAVALGDDVVRRQRAVIGSDHPDTLGTLGNVAFAYSVLGKYAESLARYEEKYATLKAKFGPDHTDTVNVLGNVGSCLAALDRHEDALKRFEEKYGYQKAKLGEDHADAIRTLSKVAACQYLLGRYEESFATHGRVYAVQKKDGIESADARFSLLRMIDSLASLDRRAEALPLIDEYVAGAKAARLTATAVAPALAVRLDHFVKRNDPAECRKTAERWESFGPTEAVTLYDVACARAVCGALFAKANLSTEAKADADRAMAWLTKAVAAGYDDLAHLEKDADLDSLRGREDYRKLVAALKEKVKK